MGELKPDVIQQATATSAAPASEATTPKQQTSKPDNAGGAIQPKARKVVDALAPRFGHPFSDVDVVTGPEGEVRAKAHGAPAVAEGKTIYLGKSVDPESAEGARIVAHEMAHIVQQNASPTPGGKSADKSAMEHEAHQVGDVVAAGGSATPKLRSGSAMAQGYGSPEHQSMGNDVHSVLDPVAKEKDPKLGGVSQKEYDQQKALEADTKSETQAPGSKTGLVASTDRNGKVATPQLAEMLKNDPFINERSRSLTISVRNFQMQKDAAGPYLAIETDPKTREVARYDVPVSPGDMTAMNGDLYGSVENMRKAPVKEVIELQKILDQEAAWETQIIAGTKTRDDKPNFDPLWEQATNWRSQRVYGGGRDFGTKAEATGGDEKSYFGLALTNQAHFGQDTKEKSQLEIKVHAGKMEELAAGPQGNAASGNEQAWVSGHARALILAREAFALKAGGPPTTPEAIRAVTDYYGHDADVPATGLVDPKAGAKALPALPKDVNNAPLKRSSGLATHDTKLNDAYVESSGADHYLTDAFAAGHQIVRNVIGNVLENFVRDKGGRDAFLSFVTKKIQEGALADSKEASGDLGKFQSKSHGWTDKAARGESWLNSKKNPMRWVGITGPGLKEKLDEKLQDPATVRSIGAKVVHDYYNRNGMIVHNAKGMTFVLKGDGHAHEAPEGRQIIAMAVLESRNQITEAAKTGTMGDPMKVWEYTPDIDKTQFTETSGSKIMNKMFADGPYLWDLIKDNFSAGDAPTGDGGRSESAQNPTEKAVREGDEDLAEPGAGAGSYAPHTPADMGQAPTKTWFSQRQNYVRSQMGKKQERPEHGTNPVTVDGVTLPSSES